MLSTLGWSPFKKYRMTPVHPYQKGTLPELSHLGAKGEAHSTVSGVEWVLQKQWSCWLQLLESISPTLDIEVTRNVLRFVNKITPSSNAFYPQRASTGTGKSKWRVLRNPEGYTNRSSYCETLTSKCSGNETWNFLILWELTRNLFLFPPLLNLSNMHQPTSLPWKQSLIFEDSDHIMLEGHPSDHLQFCARNQNHKNHLTSKTL